MKSRNGTTLTRKEAVFDINREAQITLSSGDVLAFGSNKSEVYERFSYKVEGIQATEEILLVCRDCTIAFDWRKGEQDFYQVRGLSSPTRCRSCTGQKKRERGDGEGEGREKEGGSGDNNKHKRRRGTGGRGKHRCINV